MTNPQIQTNTSLIHYDTLFRSNVIFAKFLEELLLTKNKVSITFEVIAYSNDFINCRFKLTTEEQKEFIFNLVNKYTKEYNLIETKLIIIMSTLKRYLQLRFSKPELDTLSTVFGLAATVTTILTTNGYISKQLGTTVAGISAAIVSVLINNPASMHPNTNETEKQISNEDNKE